MVIKWSIYAYCFFKYLSDNNKCDKPSDCHLWCINRSHLIFQNISKLRAVFGTYLLLGLEFLIASDILKTVLEPTLNELAILGGIVVLRTVLSVFLNKEIKELETENKDTE